ncbi:MAG: efflux RND transporter periplasmic adaptor subunit [Cyclobacteriaceae bacterium]|nr:efflux RND transporter periplasmic adaptor subunit [Cyclobacteriaceae bacterium]
MNKIFLYIVLAILSACGAQPAEEEEESDTSFVLTLSEAQRKEKGIQSGRITKQPIRTFVSATGTIDVPPNNKAAVHITQPVYIKDVRVLPGDAVKKGDILAVAFHPDILRLQEDLIKAAAVQRQLRSQFDRQSKLVEDQIVAQRDFETLRSNLSMAEAEYNAIAYRLKMLNLNPESIAAGTIRQQVLIVAPIDGRVTEMSVYMGRLIQPGEEAFVLVNSNHKHLELNVFPTDAMDVKKGQQITYSIGNGSITGSGEVYLTSPALSENQTVKVHGHLHNEDQSLLIGDFVKANIYIKTDSLYALPSGEIIHFQNRQYIFIKSGEGYRKTEIITGLSDGTYTEISGPANVLNEEVILQGNYFLNGM